MTIDGRDYRLSKHGRKRYLERVGPMCLSDTELIRRARVHLTAIWKPEKTWGPDLGDRLVTVLPEKVNGDD